MPGASFSHFSAMAFSSLGEIPCCILCHHCATFFDEARVFQVKASEEKLGVIAWKVNGFWSILCGRVKGGETFKKGLKIPCPPGRAGSIPASGTIFSRGCDGRGGRAQPFFGEACRLLVDVDACSVHAGKRVRAQRRCVAVKAWGDYLSSAIFRKETVRPLRRRGCLRRPKGSALWKPNMHLDSCRSRRAVSVAGLGWGSGLGREKRFCERPLGVRILCRRSWAVLGVDKTSVTGYGTSVMQLGR